MSKREQVEWRLYELLERNKKGYDYNDVSHISLRICEIFE